MKVMTDFDPQKIKTSDNTDNNTKKIASDFDLAKVRLGDFDEESDKALIKEYFKEYGPLPSIDPKTGKMDFGLPQSQIPAKNYVPKVYTDAIQRVRYRNLKLDTLSSDLTSLNQTVTNVYDGWQSKETMDSTKPQVENMYNRLKAFQLYNDDYGDGSIDVSEQVNAYKSALDEWDSIAKRYGKYKNADEYNKAVEASKEQEVNNNKDLALYDSEIAELEDLKKKAESIHNDWNDRLMGARGSQIEKVTNLRDEQVKQVTGGYTFEELQKALGTLKANRKHAEDYQTLQKFFSVSNPEAENYSKDFEKYSKSGLKLPANTFGGLKTGRKVEATVAEGEMYYKAALAMSHYANGEEIPDNNIFKYMKKEEFETFAYWRKYDERNGTTNAYTFIDLMIGILEEREGNDFYEKHLKDNTFLEVLYAVPVGLDQFASGVQNLFNTEDDYIPVSSTQVAGQLAREDLDDEGFKLPKWLGGSSIAQAGYDVLSTTANMAPSVLVSFFSKTAGAALMGASAAGNAYQEALNNGMDKGQARTYSTLVGVSEAALSRLLSKAFGGEAISEKLKTAIKGIDKGFLRFAANYGLAFTSEGLEEGLQEVLTPLFENIALGYNKNGFEDIDWGEVAYSYLLGGFSGGNFEVLGSGVKRVAKTLDIKKTYNTPDKVRNLLNLGLSLSEDSKANMLAKKYTAEADAKGRLSVNKVYNLFVASENFINDRLTQLGENKNTAVVAGAAVKKLTGVELSVNEIELLSKSSYGQEVLNTIVPKSEGVNSVDTSNSQLQAQSDGANASLTEAESQLLDTPDAQLTPQQRAEKQSITERLQNGENNDIINNNQETGVDIDGSTNTELLARRRVSATNRSQNSQRTYGANTEIIRISLGNIFSAKKVHGNNFGAGESGWISARNFPFARKMGAGLDKNFLGSLQGVALKNTDSIGRIIDAELQEKLSPTVFKTEDGTVISFFHWSPNSFSEFKFGDGAFHLGTLSAAITVKNRDERQREGYILEGYVISKNPLVIPDFGNFGAYNVVPFLQKNKLITDDQFIAVSQMKGFLSDRYDAPANVYVRELLKSKGYDSYLYQNIHEDLGSWSVGAFDSNQIVIIAENGVLKENSGVTEADFTESANFMPENETPSSESGEYGLSEPSDQEIHREPTAEEYNEAMFGEMKNAKQRHILDVAKKLDSGMKVVFVSKNAKVLSGKKGVYMRDSNKMYLSKDNSAVESYFQLFKHECIHRLESRGAYQGLKNYLFRNSSSFEGYARAQLKAKYKTEFEGTREEALQALAQLYIDDVQNGSFTEKFKKGFTLEAAQREMVADFISEILFKGNRGDVAQHLSDGNLEAIYDIEDTLSEFESLTETDRKWFEKIIDWIKDLIASLKGVNQNKRLVEDLEYIEKRLGRVYDSWDTKKAAKNSGGVSYFQSKEKAAYDPETATLKKQILNSKEILNSIEIVASAEYGDIKFKNKTDAKKWVLNTLAKFGGQVDRQNFGKIYFSKTDIEYAVEHLKDGPEQMALGLLPYVLKRGVEIGEHNDHKLRGKHTITFGAPIKINGIRGNMGVVVNMNGKHAYSARVLLPDGSAFVFSDKTKETPKGMHQGVLNKESLADTTNEVSNNKIPQKKDFVNTNISDEAENYSEVDENGEGSYSLGSPAQQMRDNLKRRESGEITKEEYFEETDRLWGEANETYGMLPQGENAKAPIATPQAVAEDKPTERFTRTIIETGTLTDEMLEGMEEKVLLGDFSYEVISDEKALEKADTAIKNGTAEDTWENVIHGKRTNKNQIAIGERLLKDAIESGNTKRVLELSAELADIFTRAGQVVQAARLLKKMTGAGRLVSAQRVVKTLNRDLRAKYGEDFPPIKISTEAATRLAEAKTESGIEHAYEEIMYEVAEQMPVTFMTKWNAWRYFAMLSNPKTHIRNVVGNAIFVPATRIRYFLAAVGEQAVSADKRTKSLVIKKEFRDFAKQDAKSQKVINLLKGNKYNDKSALREKQRIFKSDVLEFLTRFNSNALEAEDMLFKNKHYIHALAGFLQARNVNLETVSQKVLDEARIYAVEEAKKATFNDESALANWIQNFGNKNLATSIAVEGVLPFKRTPINIVKRGVEYSPIGLTKTLTKGLYDVKKGKITVTEFIDGLASGLTGTGIMLAGMFLANLGLISGGEDDDEKSQFEKMLGKQEYAVEIFGKSYTIDWAAPACIPFFIGAEIVNTINDGEDFQLSQFGNAVWNSLEPITNLSMLSGMQGVIESARYADSAQTLSAIAIDGLTSYGMQVVPSLAGALGRTIDPTQRSWYTDKNDKWLDSTAQTIKNNIQSKVPGLSYTQIPKIDMWGREVSRGGTAERVLENFISPGYYSEIEITETSEELKRIFNKTDIDVFPNLAAKSFELEGKTKHLTANEYVTYAKAKGEYSYDYIKEFMEDSSYERLTDEEKADVIQQLYKYANAKAKTTVSNYDLTKQFKTVTQWERNGRSAVDYYIYRAISK